MVRPVLALLASAFITCSAFGAQHFAGPMRFRTFWPCDGNGSMCGIRILAEGVLQGDTGERFADFLANPRSHEHPLPPVPEVVFDSPGGSVLGAMALGRLIRERRFGTALEPEYTHVVTEGNSRTYPPLVQEPICASACALAFAGGVNRKVGVDAKLGVHQFSAAEGALGDSTSQITVVMLAAYLEEMGVRRAILDVASLTPASSMYWLSQDEARRVQIDNTRPALAAWSIVTTAQGEGALSVTQAISPGRQVSLRLVVMGAQALLVATTLFDKAYVGQDRISQFPVGERAQLSICGARRCLEGAPVRAWTKSETRGVVSMQAAATFPARALQELASGKALTVTDRFVPALSDVTLSTALSSEGFGNGLALLARVK